MNGNIQFGVLHYHAMKLPAEKLQAVFQATDKFAFFSHFELVCEANVTQCCMEY